MTALGLWAANVPLTDEAYHLINEYIETHLGLCFPGHRRSLLEGRLQSRLSALHLGSFLEYYLHLETRGREERPHLATAVTNNETYFFRETAQIDALYRHALPQLALPAGAPLRILSAGCSSGEEAWTLRFLAEERHGAAGDLVRIEAFDVDPERVGIARRGECRARSLREMTAAQIGRYLEPAGADTWRVRDRFRPAVTFAEGNIVEPLSYRRGAAYDVVFCRNVLIYFSDASLRRAVQGFLQVLRPGGFLFLGHAESIIGMFPELDTVRLGTCIAYRKVP